MTHSTGAHEITTELAGLREPAPASIERHVMVATGLADRVAEIAGPSGPLWITWTRRGVTSVTPAVPGEDAAAHLEARLGRIVEPGELPTRLAASVERVLRTGKLGKLPVDITHLTEFQQAVLRKAAEIPPGELRSYGWVAREIGNPGAVRAVGSALNRNPIPVLIPCHRVGNSDGTVGRYAHGPEMKRALLFAEGLDPDGVDDLAERGVRYLGTDTTNVFCLPTCRHAKRVTDHHRMEFKSERAARDSGRRPCKVCRPAAA